MPLTKEQTKNLPKYLPDLFEQVSSTHKRLEKIETLRAYANLHDNNRKALRLLVQATFHPQVEWALPEGSPPYEPASKEDYVRAPNNMYRVLTSLYRFLNCPKMIPNATRREMAFTQTLESLYVKDAELLLMMKNRKLEYRGLTEKLFREAFPDWLPDNSKEKDPKN